MEEYNVSCEVTLCLLTKVKASNGQKAYEKVYAMLEAGCPVECTDKRFEVTSESWYAYKP